MRTKNLTHRTNTKLYRVYALASDPTLPHTIAVGTGSGIVCLYDMRRPTVCMHKMSGHRGWVESLVFTSKLNGRENRTGVSSSEASALSSKAIASGGSDGTVRLWDIAAGKQVRKYVSCLSHFYSMHPFFKLNLT